MFTYPQLIEMSPLAIAVTSGALAAPSSKPSIPLIFPIDITNRLQMKFAALLLDPLLVGITVTVI